MNDHRSIHILIILPRNQYVEEELFGLRDALDEAGIGWVALSPSGQEARGMGKTRFQPHGVIVDWDKQPGFRGKYHAVLIVGGRGAPKSLWDDPILPQILTDHHRAGKVVGAIGLGVAVLLRGGFVDKETAGPNDENFLQEVDSAGASLSDLSVIRSGNIITCSGSDAVTEFVQEVLAALE